MKLNRRSCVVAGLSPWGWSWAAGAAGTGDSTAASAPATGGIAADADVDASRLLRQGGVVAVFRHALAPGVYDPPGFRLGDCRTQRNLNDEGRRQAASIGAWFRTRGLQPARVLSSPWCRCLDTAHGAFGRAEPWSALGSPHASGEAGAAPPGATDVLRRALAAQAASGFDVWITHNFVISALTGLSPDSGAGAVLRADARGAVRVMALIEMA